MVERFNLFLLMCLSVLVFINVCLYIYTEPMSVNSVCVCGEKKKSNYVCVHVYFVCALFLLLLCVCACVCVHACITFVIVCMHNLCVYMCACV